VYACVLVSVCVCACAHVCVCTCVFLTIAHTAQETYDVHAAHVTPSRLSVSLCASVLVPMYVHARMPDILNQTQLNIDNFATYTLLHFKHKGMTHINILDTHRYTHTHTCAFNK